MKRRGTSPALALSVAAVLAAACQTGPRRVEGAIDPRVYEVCDDPAGTVAWEAAQAALARGDDGAALPLLRDCVERCPRLVRAHRAYQDAALRVGGDAARAMQAFYAAAAEESPNVRDYLRARLAETSYAQSNALQQILGRDPSFAWAHLSLARVNRRQGRLLQARLERAQVLAELGREEEAAVDYRAYLRGRPDDEDAMRAFVTLLLYRLGRVDEAMVLLDRLEAAHPGSAELRMDRAAALWYAGRTRDAVEAYLAVLRDEPHRARAALNIGYLYYEVAPGNEVERLRFWPCARAAFRLFLERVEPKDGHEQFERTLAVPYRLEVIDELLGPDLRASVVLDDLRWPE